MGTLKELLDKGQSPWYDNLSRSLIESGELKSLVDKGVVGVTSNPTIFDQAISSSLDYDEALKICKAKNLTPEETYWELVCADIQDAADILRPIYDDTNGKDGYVSVEVSPLLARKTAETIAQANELFSRISRDNVMIKIPATQEGLKAIEAVIANSIPVNVTLIFSQQRYKEVVQAYKDGISQVKESEKPASVASFFISRLDTKLDAALPEGSDLQGLGAIANASAVYSIFKNAFSESERTISQRPLWASTSTKNPNYSPTLYVYSLLVSHTVNTLPHKTIDAIENSDKDSNDSYSLSIDSDSEKYAEIFEKIASKTSIDTIMKELEDEGVASFENSYRSCLDSISVRLDNM